ncbi:outer membrane protein [Arsenicitalea aurantiaca]|nr:outer membrane beta-barrel protein [Arsenicitalea aurantiaca]
MKLKAILLAGAGFASLAGSTLAADLGVYDPIAYDPAPVVNSWTGFYVGVFGGIGAGDTNYTVDVEGAPSTVVDLNVSSGGGLAGVQAGYDLDVGNGFVLGIVGDVAWTNIHAGIDGTIDLGSPTDLEVSSTLTWLATLRARAGLSFENLLGYVHGGVAFGHTEREISFGTTSLDLGDAASGDRTGFVVGAGLEARVTETISLQAEYSYFDLGSDELYSGDDLGPDITFDENLSFHTIKAGLNFRF